MGSGRSNAGRISRIWAALKREHRDDSKRPDWDALTWLVCAVISDGIGDGKARAAMKRLSDVFVDWNELRVTPADEIVAVLGAVPQSREKAAALIAALNRLFAINNSLSLDFLKDKAKRDARSWLERLDGIGPAAAAAIMLHALDGHAVPVDSGVHRLMSRLGVIKSDMPAVVAQGALERHVSHRDAAGCTAVLRRHADEVCIAGEPKCSACVLRRGCPTGKDRAKERSAAGAKERSARPAKPAKKGRPAAPDHRGAKAASRG